MCMFLSQPVLAYTGPMGKLGSGFKDILTAPFQIFVQTGEQMNHHEGDEKVVAFFGGILEGAAQTAYRPLRGVMKIATFPILD